MKKVPRITKTCMQCATQFEYRVSPSRLNKGRFCSQSCGTTFNQTKHGQSKSTAYTSWATAIQRCTNPKHPKYPAYGGAGISFHPEWRESFAAFFRDMGDRPVGTTLDRINGNGNYEPSNCRWATPKEQQRNLSTNIFLELNGRRMCLTDWAKETNTDRSTLSYRIRAGWPVDIALTAKPRAYKRPAHKADSA